MSTAILTRKKDGFAVSVCESAGRYEVKLFPPSGSIGRVTIRRKTEKSALKLANRLIANARYRRPGDVERIITAIKAGQRLCRCNRVKETGEPEETYFLEPSGKSCGVVSAKAAIGSGELRPVGDGLFGDAFSQTWVSA